MCMFWFAKVLLIFEKEADKSMKDRRSMTVMVAVSGEMRARCSMFGVIDHSFPHNQLD